MKKISKKHISIIILLIIFVMFSHPAFAQSYYLPYKFKFCSTVNYDYKLFEGHVFDKNETVLIGRLLRPLPNYSEFRISDQMWGFIDNIIANPEYPEVSPDLYVSDIDNDGLDEIIIPFIGKKGIKFLLYDYKNGKTKITEIFKIQLTDERKTQYNIYFSHININKSKEDELLININSAYPKSGSLRGLFAIDIKKRKQLWFYPTAEYYSANALFTYANKYILMASSAVSNGIAFSNKTFFKINKNEDSYKPFKTAYTDIYSTKLDTTAKDYSTDQTADIICLDKNGKKIWEKEFGKEFVWGTMAKNKNNIVYCPKHRYSKDTVKSKLFLITPANGKILKEKTIKSENLQGIGLNNKRIFVYYANAFLDVYDFNFKKLNTTPIHKTIILDYFEYNRKHFYLGTSFQNMNNYTIVLNDNFEVIAKSKLPKDPITPQFLPLLKKISLYDNKLHAYSLYDLVYIPWYKRISPYQLWRYSFITSLLLIILLFTWGYSHYKSSKTITEQKIKLEKTTAELIRKEKLSVLGTIASGVAHELNSPLGAILNSSQRILQNDKLETIDKENAKLIEKATLSCKRIVEKFLTSSKPNSTITGANFEEVFNSWFKLFGKSFSSNGITIITNFEENCLLKINTLEIGQIINNIIQNSKHQLLTTNKSEKRIEITTNRNNDFCKIIFEDNGGGFPKEILKHKFEAFHTTKKEGEGTGLGLWIIKNIIDDINGKIDITNSKEGAKIIIEIPLLKKDKNNNTV